MDCWKVIEKKAAGYRRSVRGVGGNMGEEGRWLRDRERGRR